MIPQSFIQDLLGRVDIVDVIEQAVPLKRAGTNLVACCPFHNEKSPSFTVSPSKQFYHCFGCGAHGTAISFLMEHHGMGFIDAVRDLAQRVGMVVPEIQRSEAQEAAARAAPALTELLARAAKFYKDQLKRSSAAIDYLKRRGLTGDVAAKFGLGYAPDGWQNLAVVFGDYQSPQLLEAGLVIASDEGRRYDRFRDRIMFPIVNPRGDIIGFGGRVLGGGEPKYLNSPETPVFEKGRELYGLFQARQAIRRENRVIVVEGYMDVVALAQHGVGNAVATLGTATTPHHLQKLLRQADRVTFCFDGDGAGRRAAWRALEVSLPVLVDGKQVQFLFLPESDDPDTYVRAHGAEAFQRLVAQAEPLSSFMLRELQSRVDMGTPEGKAAFLKEADALTAQITARNLARAMKDAVARAAGLALASEPRGRFGTDRRPMPASPQPRSDLRNIDWMVLRILAARPELYASVAHVTDIADGEDGYWPLIRDLSLRLESGELPATTVSILEDLRERGRADVAGKLGSWLMENEKWLDTAEGRGGLEEDLGGFLRNLEARKRRTRVQELLRSSPGLHDLSDDDRELIVGGSRQ